MSWKERTVMSLRREFVALALEPGATVSTLCDRFGISRKTGYKWLARYRSEGEAGLSDRSKHPHSIPNQIVDAALVEAILSWRVRRGWGGRKIRWVLLASGYENVPSASTISEILKRHNMLVRDRRAIRDIQRFEADAPNDLWQMDFKGPIRVRDGICEPFTILDDHSRYSLAVIANRDQSEVVVKQHLTNTFRRYGMPWRILADNGNPWGKINQFGRHLTRLEVWLMSLGIRVSHSRSKHPQTCGKEERFHRTLKQELTGKEMNCLYAECQARFDAWRDQYNRIRPHEGIGMVTPANRYHISERNFPETVPKPEYDSTDEVRAVHSKGVFSYKGHRYKLGNGFCGQHIALRPTDRENIVNVFFYRMRIAKLDTEKEIVLGKVLPMSPNKV